MSAKKLLFSRTSLVALGFLALNLRAADPPNFKLWKAQELKAYAKSENLADFGNHTVVMNHREVSGEAEIHESWNDVMVIQSGEATLRIGGKLVDPHTTGPGEIRAEKSTGYETKSIAPGDILHIPANTAHQFIVAPGKQVTYFAMKVPAK